jgi:hypothetical protein
VSGCVAGILESVDLYNDGIAREAVE